MEVARVNKLENIHPGEVLLEEFLVPMGLSQNRIAREIGADAVIYQDLEDLVDSVRDLADGMTQMCHACFSGEYPTGDVTAEGLLQIERARLQEQA